MTAQFPLAVATYLAAVDRKDLDGAMATFTDDATVVDEGNTYRGAAIREWRATVATEFTYTSEFRRLEMTDESHCVAEYHLEGDFPGGVVDLKFWFTLRGELIEHLEIAS